MSIRYGCRAQSQHFASQTTQFMKKYIFVLDAIKLLAMLACGKRVQGVLFIDQNTGRLTFKPYYSRGHHGENDVLVKTLEHGWVKESPKRIKVYESMPKDIGTARMMSTLDREMKVAKEALIDRELIEFI